MWGKAWLQGRRAGNVEAAEQQKGSLQVTGKKRRVDHQAWHLETEVVRRAKAETCPGGVRTMKLDFRAGRRKVEVQREQASAKAILRHDRLKLLILGS